MVQPLRIDFVSDIACPWCVIGLRSLLQALEGVRDEVTAELRFQPFELNPDMPAQGENVAEHVQKKYGSTPERSAAVRQAIKQHGEALGFTFNYGPDSRIWNTFDAHRLLHWAGLKGRQLELKQALFKSNFTDQRPTSDHAALAVAGGARDSRLWRLRQRGAGRRTALAGARHPRRALGDLQSALAHSGRTAAAGVRAGDPQHPCRHGARGVTRLTSARDPSAAPLMSPWRSRGSASPSSA